MSSSSTTVGIPKAELLTPALCLDLDKLESNVRSMVSFCKQHNVHWRPHAKCHKSPVIGRWLVDAGAIGLTCATIYEAEVMADAGISDLLLANMIAGPAKIARLVELSEKSDVIICVDHVSQAEPISAALSIVNRNVRVLIELEIGMNRVGAASKVAALRLAERVHDLPNLNLTGVMAYEGHLLTIEDAAEKKQAIREALSTATQVRDLFHREGLPCDIVSCGGTGSFPITIEQPGITEIQAGGAIFMDAFYREMCGIGNLEHALTILATVGSLPTSDRAVIDAGRKAMNIDIYPPQVIDMGGITVDSLSAEHGKLTLTNDAPTLEIGQQIELIPGYADLTNVLHPCFYGIRDGIVEREIPIVR